MSILQDSMLLIATSPIVPSSNFDSLHDYYRVSLGILKNLSGYLFSFIYLFICLFFSKENERIHDTI